MHIDGDTVWYRTLNIEVAVGSRVPISATFMYFQKLSVVAIYMINITNQVPSVDYSMNLSIWVIFGVVVSYESLPDLHGYLKQLVNLLRKQKILICF